MRRHNRVGQGGSAAVKAYLEPSEVERMELAADNLRDRLLIRVLFHLGCRVTEGLGLAVEDIDIEGGLITIQHLKMRLHLSCPECAAPLASKTVFCPRCGIKVEQAVARELERRRQRVIPVDAGTLAMLQEYILRGGPVLKHGRHVLFGINRHRGWQIVRECANKAGLPDLINPDTGKRHHVSPHKLRDAFAVNAMKHDDSGEGMRLLQEHLGHASFNTTAKYRKIAGDEHREWYRRLWQERGNGG
jgi:integrase/recombinase XerD